MKGGHTETSPILNEVRFEPDPVRLDSSYSATARSGRFGARVAKEGQTRGPIPGLSRRLAGDGVVTARDGTGDFPREVSSTQGKKSECITKLGKSIASQWKSMTTQRKNIRVHNQIGKSIVSQ